MGSDIGKALRRLLAEAGFRFLRQGKGDHEIWHHPERKLAVTVDAGCRSRHTANAILK